MKLTLLLNGKEKEYFPRITARKTRTAYEERAKIDAALTDIGHVFKPQELDDMLKWVVELFDGQFTADEFLDGYQGSIFDIAGMMSAVFELVVSATAAFPKRKAGATETTDLMEPSEQTKT